ncbi:MAG: 50S ribosomal protein L13 [Candidatus Nealsonbacteria bacterium]|nr:50S ribosomal protein L13 [Candidatus Nealsonbacteria bacterium]
MDRKTHTIDATGKVLGRLATEIVALLRGKNKPGFAPYKDFGDIVVVQNAGKMKITGAKLEQTQYFRHSGYLGGERETPLKKVFKEKPGEVLKRAVLGMLPKNKLRIKMIKRLRFAE